MPARLAEQQRAADADAARARNAAARQRQQEIADLASRDALERREREQVAQKQAGTAAQAHTSECRASYRSRFLDMQKALENFAAMKSKMTAECARLAKHCTVFSGGPSVCHGITGAEQQVFDGVCSIWPRLPIVGDANEACADVDSERLGFDFTWSNEAAAAFRARAAPAP